MVFQLHACCVEYDCDVFVMSALCVPLCGYVCCSSLKLSGNQLDELPDSIGSLMQLMYVVIGLMRGMLQSLCFMCVVSSAIAKLACCGRRQKPWCGIVFLERWMCRVTS